MTIPVKTPSAKTAAPLVSVCIPVYNGERYIVETIQSVISQKHTNIEIVVQDNASQDGTWDILKAMSCRDSRLSIMKNATNVGMAPNWNLVVNRARGEYIMLLSADDLISPTLYHPALIYSAYSMLLF
jgi:glycosyltransferase involved in cell wall biosynthesis